MSEPHKMLSLDEVVAIVRVGKSTIRQWEGEGRFPRGRLLSANRKFWFADEVTAWQETLPLSRTGANRQSR
jgi:predicted DNA-binding transcriptional regulator AlpA